MGLIPQNLLVSKSTHIKILKSSKNGKFGRESEFKGVKGKNLVLFLNNEDSSFKLKIGLELINNIVTKFSYRQKVTIIL